MEFPDIKIEHDVMISQYLDRRNVFDNEQMNLFNLLLTNIERNK